MSSVNFSSKTENPNYPGVIDISAEEVKELHSQLKIIDVRQPEEFTGELGHIENASLLVLDQLPQKFTEISTDEDVVFICRSGNRSAQACAMLQTQGYQRVFNMAGGMIRWNELEYPTQK